MTAPILVTYLYHGNSPQEVADAIRVEQTIEFPYELAQTWIQESIVGKIEEIVSEQDNRHRITISFNPDVVGGELTQLLNVLWGNASLFPSLKIIDINLPHEIVALFKGPRFGIEGLRTIFNAPTRPLLTTALKPMGSDSKTLAEMARILAISGFDMIKDDHSLANQPWSMWEERVRVVSSAVAQANAHTGGTCMYTPSLNLPFDRIRDAAYTAKEVGAGALLVLPGITGFDSMRVLAEDDQLALPIQAHPSLLGSFVTSPQSGITHGVLFGTLMRLAGADISIFPNTGGRFSFTLEQCMQIQEKTQSPLGDMKKIWIAPAGGMTIERIPEIISMYGRDTALLIGGALSRGTLSENARRMTELVHSLA
ncbi:MAG: ribulose 1,5-bisphosphate carboxylase large subunit [Candidatus Planktophila sp.]|nr:ribulose 1,5-bisphosphate carboxylase large subunit [Candidatus Planktophila sp.]